MNATGDKQTRRLASTLVLAAFISLRGNSTCAESELVGTNAPELHAPGVEVHVKSPDEHTSKPITLVFVKPGDMHSARAIEALQIVHNRNPSIAAGSDTIVVVTRVTKDFQEEDLGVPKNWEVLYDNNDSLYVAYHIIATPTVIIVGRDKRIIAFHPGYSKSLADEMRFSLVRAIEGDAVAFAPTPTPGIMKVQMGRQLAKAGLWDRAIEYYEDASKVEKLPPEILLEHAELYLQVGKYTEALALLDSITDPTDKGAVRTIRERAQQMKDGKQPLKKPPKIR